MNPIEDALNGEMMSEVRRKAVDAGKDPDLAELEALAAKVHAKGVDYRIEDGRLLPTTVPQERPHSIKIDLGKEHIRLGIASDTHGGSHFEQLSALRRFYQYGDEREVDLFINGGDLTQGSDRMHPDQPFQIHVHGAEQQVGYVVGTYPHSERGAKTVVLSGNHDDSFLKDGGLNVVRMITSARDDMTYLGQTAAYLTVGGLKIYVIHPRGGKPYADSYRLQRVAESLPISKQVNLMLMGHLHAYCVDQVHGITSLLLPCFQSQYGWLASGGLHPAIGGIIADIWLTDNGEVARIGHEFVRFQAIDDDWDHEVSQAVAKGWTPTGLVMPTPKTKTKVRMEVEK
jgi:predicted phosphodiesterase